MGLDRGEALRDLCPAGDRHRGSCGVAVLNAREQAAITAEFDAAFRGMWRAASANRWTTSLAA
jgi:hypothetical protein